MIRKIALGLAAATTFAFAVPAIAQDEEEPRTTYEIRFVDIAPGKQQEWFELAQKHFMPAREAAGLPPVSIHWLMTGDYDIMMLMPMPGGMATMDTHNPADGQAMWKALVAQEGSEDAVNALFAKASELTLKSKSLYSHTHP